jgi:acyl carrier protein phosphodiesterase
MFPFMKSQNWLYNYQFRWGLRNSFGGLVRRALYLEDSDTAFQLFESHAGFLLQCYRTFMPDVHQHAEEQYRQLRGQE